MGALASTAPLSTITMLAKVGNHFFVQKRIGVYDPLALVSRIYDPLVSRSRHT